jgi:hypothetical protein
VSSQPQNIPTYSLSPQQELLFLLPDEVATTQAAIVVADSVSEPQLRSALQELASRHEILRTTFARVPGRRMPQQVIHDTPALACRRHGDIPLRALFAAPTIAALAEAVEATETSPAGR